MLKRMSTLFILGFTLGACDSMSQMEYDAKVLNCFEIKKVEDKYLYTTDGFKYKLFTDNIEGSTAEGNTACGRTIGNGHYRVDYIGEDAKRIQDFQKYNKELEVNNAKQTKVK